MQTSQKHRASASVHGSYGQPQPFHVSHIHILDNNGSSDIGSQGTPVSFQTYKDQFFTLNSSTTSAGYDSPSAVSVNSNRSPFSSNSVLSDLHHSPDTAYGSPFSGSSVADDNNNNPELRHKLREIEVSLLGPEPDSDNMDTCNCCFTNGATHAASVAKWNQNQLMEMIPKLDLKQILIACGREVYEGDMSTAAGLMHVLEQMVSVSGEPNQRLGAYVLEGLRARLESSGSKIYKALRCEEPTSSDLMSYMTILFKTCPYWQFAYTSANAVIKEAVENESSIHVIDFQIAQGTQWMYLMAALEKRPGGPPRVRITGIDDSQSNHARGGGLSIVGGRLANFAKEHNVPFEFHDAAMSGCEVRVEHLRVQPGEAIVVNFPYVLHHIPDESVNIWNHRDRLLRLVKSLSPKVVTLVEQESNTNTSPFLNRFIETLDYYTAMFESIDASPHPRNDRQRISAEQNCVARDIVNMIACEGAERVERHELFGKWRSRLQMAEFTPCPLSSSASIAVSELLTGFHGNYRIEERDGALFLGWKNRAMATSSAWSLQKFKEAVEKESSIHVIDFQIAQGTQWMYLMAALAKRPGGPPRVRITGIDDSQSNHARGGGLSIVGERLANFAREHNVPFEFHDAAMSGCEVRVEHLRVQPGEAIVVNFPYVLHHIPDESVNIWNHRDRLLRLVKSLSPKVVTLVEQESNTNTSPFLNRFIETLDYYTAMFESIDVSPHPRNDRQRISAEQNCVARDIVNMIACEGAERVERHELFGKWKSRLQMAGFTPCPLSSSASIAVSELLTGFHGNYRIEERDGALFLGWKNRAMATSSAWR